ncbi:MAG TPA: bacteriohemerythrin [Stellaceae bacterium]|nr:bacteriohemerythrin [Stellaceae bacterium]
MLIVWRDQMSVDGGVIDSDHKVLIGIINEFSAVEATASAVPMLKGVLAKLDQYAKTHFEREERLQKSVSFPFHQAHVRAHEGLIRQLSEVEAKLNATAATTNAAELAALHTRLAEFLHHWLIDHIIGTDLRMKPFTKAMRPLASKLGE